MLVKGIRVGLATLDIRLERALTCSRRDAAAAGVPATGSSYTRFIAWRARVVDPPRSWTGDQGDRLELAEIEAWQSRSLDPVWGHRRAGRSEPI